MLLFYVKTGIRINNIESRISRLASPCCSGGLLRGGSWLSNEFRSYALESSYIVLSLIPIHSLFKFLSELSRGTSVSIRAALTGAAEFWLPR